MLSLFLGFSTFINKLNSNLINTFKTRLHIITPVISPFTYKFTVSRIITRTSKYTFNMCCKFVGNVYVYVINVPIDINLFGNIFLRVSIPGFPELWDFLFIK